MAKKVFTGRYTVDGTEDLVVFIIGMRINKPLAIHKWLPVFTAMPPMMKELYTHKDDLGFLSMENYFGLRTTCMITYWESMEDLLDYSRGNLHLEAWKEFNQKVANNDAVGIYHETYVLYQGNYETIYRNMPKHGILKALPQIPLTKEMKTAEKRLSG